MSVKIRPYRRGGFEVDIVVKLADGAIIRNRKRSPVASRSGSLRWGQERERMIFQLGRLPERVPEPQQKEEVPTLEEFTPRYVEGHLVANRRKPSAIEAYRSILRTHLLPQLGKRRLDSIADEDIQSLKARLANKSPKTVNNVLSVLSTLLKTAKRWKVIPSFSIEIGLLKVARKPVEFYEFHQYADLVTAAEEMDTARQVTVLLGGDAGLRRGEIIALEWTDCDLRRSQLTVRQSEWMGHVTVPKGGQPRIIPMTRKLHAALVAHRHLRGPRVLYREDGNTLTSRVARNWLNSVQHRAGLRPTGLHILRHSFCSHLAMRGAPTKAIQELAGHQQLSTTQRYMHLAPSAREGAIRLLDDRSEGTSALGDILETGPSGLLRKEK
jgi:integrase